VSLAVVAQKPEPYVDAKSAAQYLSISPKKLLDLARSGRIPAHGIGGFRKMWRFRLSELDHWMQTEVTSAQRLRPCSRRIS
jgi:excisionase family DNA binding protein